MIGPVQSHCHEGSPVSHEGSQVSHEGSPVSHEGSPVMWSDWLFQNSQSQAASYDFHPFLLTLIAYSITSRAFGMWMLGILTEKKTYYQQLQMLLENQKQVSLHMSSLAQGQQP